jgi:hypothetical protein
VDDDTTGGVAAGWDLDQQPASSAQLPNSTTPAARRPVNAPDLVRILPPIGRSP